MDAVRLGEIALQAARVVGELGIQVEVAAAALGTKLLDSRVDDGQPVRRKAGQAVGDWT